jgi:hypothetical protein
LSLTLSDELRWTSSISIFIEFVLESMYQSFSLRRSALVADCRNKNTLILFLFIIFVIIIIIVFIVIIIIIIIIYGDTFSLSLWRVKVAADNNNNKKT